MKKQIVCIGLPTWEGDYLKSTVQLIKALTTYYDILYVEYTFTWIDVWRGGAQVPVNRILGGEPRLRKLSLENGNSLQVLTLPPFLPANWLNPIWHDIISNINVKKALRILKKTLKKLQFQNPIVINAFQPGLGAALKGKLNESLLVYYCYDEISAAPWIGKHGARLEARFLPQADIVITSSDPLQNQKASFNPNCHVIKNGVDITQFQKIITTPDIEDQEYYQHVIGYIGSIDNRLDYNLLSYTIEAMSDCLFVFVGRIMDENGFHILQEFDNVHILGAKPAQELPAYVQQFDVGLIPFIKNKLTAGIYPMKINEYLALGKPVVATNFADLRDFEPLINIANDASEFVRAIRYIIEYDSPTYAQLRKEMASSNSWENRALAFHHILEKHDITTS